MYIYVHIYIFIMNVYRSNCEASTMKERKRLFVLFFFFVTCFVMSISVFWVSSPDPTITLCTGACRPPWLRFGVTTPFSKE